MPKSKKGAPSPALWEGMDVRVSAPADLAALRTLFRAAFEAPAARLGYRPSPMDADYADLISARFVLCVDGVAAGGPEPDLWAAAVLRPRRTDLYIEAFAVHPDAQRARLGAGLMHQVEALAGALCFERVRLHTAPQLEAAMRFYAALGYREVGRTGRGRSARALFEKATASQLFRTLNRAPS